MTTGYPRDPLPLPDGHNKVWLHSCLRALFQRGHGGYAGVGY